MKFVIYGLLGAVSMMTTTQGRSLSIPESHLSTCDSIGAESERLTCLSMDLAQLEVIREQISVLGDPEFRMQHSLVDGDGPKAPAADPKKSNKIHMTSKDWWVYVISVCMAYCCFECTCITCI